MRQNCDCGDSNCCDDDVLTADVVEEDFLAESTARVCDLTAEPECEACQ